MGKDDSDFSYVPSKPAAIIFTILFAITMVVHIIQSSRARALFMLTLVIATFMEVLGYITRYIAIINDPQLWSYVTSQVAIVVAPSFLGAQDYMIVGRMMAYVGPESTFISHSIITKLFVIIDVICVMSQAGGAAMLSGSSVSKDSVTRGRSILIGGLILQVTSFGIFLLIAILFDLKAQKLKGDQLKPLRPLFIAFYISAVLIIGRSVYRTIEFATINFDSQVQGYLFDHEWPAYILDGLPILISIAVFNIFNPAAYLPRKKGLRMDGTIEPPRKHWWSKSEKMGSVPSQDYLMVQHA